jgi:CDP-diacylglycerol--glycerol-3-phosphate 3-phosphatidyltransferase
MTLRHLPNALSLARLLAAPLLVALALVHRERAFALLLVAALVTDVLDGWIARRFQLQSEVGAALDSAGDVTTLAAAAVGIACFHPGVWYEHLPAIGAVLGGWALVCVFALLRYRRLSSFHTYASKAAGYALGFFIAVLFAFGFVSWLFYLAVALSLASTAEELLLLWRLPRWRADVRGLLWVMRGTASDLERG